MNYPARLFYFEVWAWSFHHHHPSLPLLGVCEQPPHSDTLTSGSKTKGLDLMYSRWCCIWIWRYLLLHYAHSITPQLVCHKSRANASPVPLLFCCCCWWWCCCCCLCLPIIGALVIFHGKTCRTTDRLRSADRQFAWKIKRRWHVIIRRTARNRERHSITDAQVHTQLKPTTSYYNLWALNVHHQNQY